MMPKGQRIGILVIAAVMIVGTLSSFVMMILANENQTAENSRLAEESQLLMEQQQEQQAQQQKEAGELSGVYFSSFKQYESRPTAFDANSVGDKVSITDVKVGDGEVLTKDSKNYRAYYLGWNPEGDLFDGSIEGDKLKSPLDLSQMTLIPGWYDGVEGMKIGGVREITIPAELAYGETGAGEAVAPNTPIRFLIMAIPAAE